MKFSLIVPIYNGERYIDRCLNSLINQTYDNFEIIVINDGSIDDSKNIIKNFIKTHKFKIKFIDQTNKGLSYSRNKGLKNANGDYILFVDVDDVIANDTLLLLNQNLKNNNFDLIKFDWTNKIEQLNITENKKEILSGENALKKLILNKDVFEMATIYTYNLKFLKKTHFEFQENKYHEDFGVIPLTILKAEKVLIIDNKLYFYEQSNDNSITRNNDYDKTLKKAKDCLFFFKKNKKEISEFTDKKEILKLYNSFSANAVISKINTLNKEDKSKFVLEAKKAGVFDDLQKNSIKQKIKYYYIKAKFL